jgi:hypothetical protein
MVMAKVGKSAKGSSGENGVRRLGCFVDVNLRKGG